MKQYPTWWDIGLNDMMTIWFTKMSPKENHHIPQSAEPTDKKPKDKPKLRWADDVSPAKDILYPSLGKASAFSQQWTQKI
jgi:hypothetical protein